MVGLSGGSELACGLLLCFRVHPVISKVCKFQLAEASISDLRLSITLQDNEADAPLIKEMEDGICVVSCQNHALASLQIISHR